MTAYLIIFLGGGLGSIARYAIGQGLMRYNLQFPLATLLANLCACLILGYLIGLNLQGSLQSPHRLLLATGFCGGFSTFSTFSAETLHLLQHGQYAYAFLNIAGSLLLCLAAVYMGIKAVS
jgi:CrcB protein